MPINHRNSALRSASEANIVELVNNIDKLSDENKAPKYLIPSDQLGRVPLGALSIRDEVSVSARLEALEVNIGKVCSFVERMNVTPPTTMAGRLDKLEEDNRSMASRLGQIGAATLPSVVKPTFASVLTGQVPGIVVINKGGG